LRAIPAALNKKYGELGSTNKEVIDADIDPPKIDCARYFKQLQSLVANIPERIKTSTTGNKFGQPPSLTHWTKKIVNFGPVTKKL